MDLVEIRKASGDFGHPFGDKSTPPYRPMMDPGPIPSDWVPYTSPRAAKAARKAKMLRAAKIGGAAGATSLAATGAIAARAAMRKPATTKAVSRQVSPRALAAIGGGAAVAGTGGGLVLRKRKKERS